MGKKKVKKDGVYFLGKSCDDVTGSQYFIRFGKCQCLLECGLYQSSSNSYLDSYRINSEKFKFKPSELDYVFVCHAHIDHTGNLPRLVKEGFHGKIICTAYTAAIMKSLLLNSNFIIEDEARILSKRYHRDYKPLYSVSDVYDTLNLIEIYDEYDKIYQLNDTISFQWLQNAHCLGAAQLQLIFNSKEKSKKVLYTSDLGALHTKNHYLKDTEIPDFFNDLVIMESTYGSQKRCSRRGRKTDLEHFSSAVNTTLERGGTVVMPCFSFSRTQEVLTTLFELYGDDVNFKTPIYVDSKLSCEICELYTDILSGDNLSLWKRVISWDNVNFITDKDESKACVKNYSTPKIIISSSGFCTNGRIVNYLKQYLSDINSMIIFSGYAGDNPSYLSYRIKNYRSHKFLSINKEKIRNLADCVTLSTFSSHADYDDLLKFGSSLRTNKLVLVHGSEESKKSLAIGLKEAISKNDKTYRVVNSVRGMAIHF